MKKKVISIVLTAVLLFALMPFVGASGEGGGALTTPVDAFVLDSNGGAGTITGTPSIRAGSTFGGILSFHNISGRDAYVKSIEMVTSTSISSFPFEIKQLNYIEAPKSLNKVEITNGLVGNDDYCYYHIPDMYCRSDAPQDFYTISFIITYNSDDSEEYTSQTLSLVIKVLEAASEPSGSEVPTIIVTGFNTSPSSVVAGEAFTLFVTFKNTSSSTAVSNLKAQLTSDGTFVPVSGSSTLFADSLGAGASTTMSIHLDTKAEAAPGSYSVGFNISYSYSGAKELANDTETISIPVSQVPKIKVTAIQTSSPEVFLGQEVNIMSQINNTGKGTIYNATVKFSDAGGIFTESELYLGNISPGATGNIDTYLPANSVGEGTILMTVTYEDEGGEVYTYTDSCSVFVSERMDYGGKDPYFPDEPIDEPSGGLPLGLIILIVIVLAVVGLIVFLSIRKKNKKKLQRYMDRQEALRLDRELLDSEDNEDIHV